MESIEDWDIGTPVHLGLIDRERVEVSVLRIHDVEVEGASRLAVPESPPNTALQHHHCLCRRQLGPAPYKSGLRTA